LKKEPKNFGYCPQHFVHSAPSVRGTRRKSFCLFFQKKALVSLLQVTRADS
jgi:hypothetical protein